MRHVELCYDYQNQYPTIKVDGEHISKYSDLGIVENRDIYQVAKKLKVLIPDELEDCYDLFIKGPTFVGKLMSKIMEDDICCKVVRYQESEGRTDFEHECRFIESLMKKYGREDAVIPSIKVTGPAAPDIELPFIKLDEEADWFVDKLGFNIVPGLPVIIIGAKEFDFDEMGGGSCTFLPSGFAEDFFDYIYERKILVPFAAMGRSICAQMNLRDAEAITLQAYSVGKALYKFELEKDTVDVGEECECNFSVYPVDKSDDYRLEILPKGAAFYSNGRLKIHSGKEITIRVVDKEGKIQESHIINVIYHNYVTDIRIFPESIEMEMGEKCAFEYYPIPADAEDIDDIRFTISDPQKAAVIDKKYIVGLNAGKVDLLITGKRFNKKASVHVVPNLKGLFIDEHDLSLELGNERTFRCIVSPMDARYEKPEWKLDNTKLGKIEVSEDGLTCRYNATTDACVNGFLICSIPGTDMQDKCNIQIKPIDQPTILMALSWIFTGIGCIAGLFVFPVAAASGSAVSGYFMDFFMPIGLVMAIIGRGLNNKHSNDVFMGAILTNVLYAVLMILVGAAACGGLRS